MSKRKRTYYNEIQERESRHILLQCMKAFNRMTLVLILLGSVALFGYHLYQWALSAPMFELKRITVRGNHLVSEEMVLGLTGVAPRWNLFRLNTDEIQERLAENCLIRKAKVRRRWPSGILISIVERQPIACLEHSVGAVDDEGVLLPPLSPEKCVEIPILTGIDVGDELCGQPLQSEKVRWAISFLRTVSERCSNVSSEIAEIDMSDVDQPFFYSKGKDIPIRIHGTDCCSRLASLPAVFTDLERRSIVAEYIDVRFKGQIVVKPKMNMSMGLESQAVKG